MPNDEFYRSLREKVSGYTGAYADQVLLVPDLFLLITRLMLDSRIEGRHKVYMGAALAYVISPIDLLSEGRFGVLGYLDDLVVIVAALNILVNEADRAVVLEHWSGKEDSARDHPEGARAGRRPHRQGAARQDSGRPRDQEAANRLNAETPGAASRTPSAYPRGSSRRP